MSQRIHLDATPGLFHQVLHCHQGDVGRQFEIAVVTRDGYEIPSGATFKIQATKPSGLGFTVTGTAANNIISFTSTEDMTSEAGEIPTQLEIKSGNDVIYTSNFLLVCEKNTHPASITDGSPEEIISEITLLVERAESAASTAGADAAAAAQARVDEMMDYLPSEVADLKSEISDVPNNIFLPEINKCDPSLIVSGIIGDSSGRIDENSSYATTGFIDVSDFQNGYYVNKAFRRFLAYDANKAPITASYDSDYHSPSAITYNSSYKYVRFSLYSNGLTNIMIGDSATAIGYVPFSRRLMDGVSALNDVTKAEIDSIVPSAISKVGKNKCNPEDFVSGFINSSDGSIGESTSYYTTGFIDVSDFQYGYTINHRYRKALAYDENKVAITSTYVTDETPAGTIAINPAWKYLRFSLFTADDSRVMVEDSTSVSTYESYKVTLIDGISALNDVTKAEVEAIASANTSGVLYNKKWYACGDSFTIGDFTGLADGYTFEDEPYKNQPKVYPYFIGRRCGMNVVNLAVGGQTMAKVAGRTNFVDAVYQDVGADADYITMKFGINDGHQSVPIGTIDSSDITTFYGAWNTVMTWLITNRPTAKIGIIVSNGLDSNNYAEATIAIAKKYGVPYLNEWSGEQIPLMLRSGRTDVDASIKQIRNETFRVSAENQHPNPTCQEYESTYVEQFLKSL